MSKSASRIGDVDVFDFSSDFFLVASMVALFTLNYETEHFGYLITNICVMLFIATQFIAFARGRRFSLSGVVAVFFVFLAFCGLSLLWTVSFERSLHQLETLVSIGFFMAAISMYLQHDGERHLRLFLKAMVLSSIVSCLYVLLTFNWSDLSRANGVIGDANQACAYLAYCLPLGYYCWRKRMVGMGVFVVQMVLVLATVLASGTRSGLITCVLGFLLLWFIQERSRGFFSMKNFGLIVLGVALLAALLYFIMHNDFAYQLIGSRFEQLLHYLTGTETQDNYSSTYDYSARERAGLLNLAIEVWLQSPVWGSGLNGFSYYAAIMLRDTFCHNNYLEILTGVGIIGLAIYYSQHLLIFKGALKSPLLEKTVVIAVIVQMLVAHVTVVFFALKLEVVFIVLLYALSQNHCGSAEKDASLCSINRS